MLVAKRANESSVKEMPKMNVEYFVEQPHTSASTNVNENEVDIHLDEFISRRYLGRNEIGKFDNFD